MSSWRHRKVKAPRARSGGASRPWSQEQKRRLERFQVELARCLDPDEAEPGPHGARARRQSTAPWQRPSCGRRSCCELGSRKPMSKPQKCVGRVFRLRLRVNVVVHLASLMLTRLLEAQITEQAAELDDSNAKAGGWCYAD